MLPAPEALPDVLHFWTHTWTKRGYVWVGPPTGDPTPHLPQRWPAGASRCGASVT
jgi:hypothetical protein